MRPDPRQQTLRQELTQRAAICLISLGVLCVGALAAALALLVAMRDMPALPAVPASVALALCLLLTARLGRWLWVPAAVDRGIPLSGSCAPGFRRRIDRLCERLGARRVHDIEVTPDINAAVVCRPAWGVIGPMRTTLLVGIPLAHSLTAPQLAAVLAHELAHLAAQRNGAEAWRAHLRTWWLRCYDRIDEDSSWPGAIARRLLDATARIDLHQSLQLSRLDEFEADALAARAVGKHALASALLEVAMKDRFLTENYWRKVMDQAHHRRRPSFRPFRDMGFGMQAGFARQDALAGLRDHLSDDSLTGDMDTHPCLAERLAALRIDDACGQHRQNAAPSAGPSAAEHYFASVLPALSLTFDRMWWHASAHDWRHRYSSACGAPDA
jgi:Zn-dependent protease with chaperone function